MPQCRTIGKSQFKEITFIFLILISSIIAKTKVENELLSQEPFTIHKETLLNVSIPTAPEGLDAIVLLDKIQYNLHSDGTVTTSYHTIYKILTPEGVKNWAYTSSSYQPWYQNKPLIKARVITQEGVEQYLDTNTIVTQSASTTSNSYTDRHQLSAPLPNIRVGAIVEEYTEIRDNKPYFKSGRNFSSAFYAYNYTWIKNISIKHSKEMKIQYHIRGGDFRPKTTTKDGIKHISYTQKDLKPLYAFPATTLPHIPIIPFLTFSTAKDWNAIATEYEKEVDAQIDTSLLKPIADSITANETDSMRIVEKLVKFIHDEVRYTAYELGDKSLIPVTPQETLNKKYGDCKDKATLLIGLLRCVGFNAHIALLNTGPGLDIDPLMPGTDRFDHAIVHLQLGEKSLWIDATAEYTPVGIVPPADQNRYILIASSTSKSLQKTPKAKPMESGFTENVTVIFNDDSTATIYENTKAEGTVEASLRYSFDATKEQFIKNSTSYCKDRYDGIPTDVQNLHMKDLTKKLDLALKIEDAKYFTSYDDGAMVTLSPYGLFQYLPDVLFNKGYNLDSLKEHEKRYSYADRYPVYITTPHVTKTNYHLISPKGYVWKSTPDALEVAGYGLSLRRDAKMISKDTLLISYCVQMDSSLIDTSAIDSVKNLITKFDETANVTVDYVYLPDDLITQGNLKQGLDMHKEIVKKEKSVNAHLRYAEALNQLQFTEEARKITQKALAIEPNSAKAHFAMGLYYLHNPVGQYMFSGLDLEKAKMHLQKAIALDTTKSHYYAELYPLYLINDRLDRFGPGCQIDSAISIISVLKDRFEDNSHDLELLRAYMWKGEYEKADNIASATAESSDRNMLWVAIRYLNKGLKQAENKARELSSTNYIELLVKASSILMVLNKYAEAGDILENSTLLRSAGFMQPTEIEMFKMATQKEEILNKRSELEQRISTDFINIMTQAVSKEEFIKQCEEESKGRYFAKSSIEAFISGSTTLDNLNLPLEFVANLMVCQLRFTKEEVGNAVRIKVFKGNNSEELLTYYFEKQRKKYRVVDITSTYTSLNTFSHMALAALKSKKRDDALVWLKWGREEIKEWGMIREKYQFSNAIKELLPEKMDALSMEKLRLGAAVLSYANSDNKEAIKVVKEYPIDSLDTDEKKFALQWYRTIAEYYETPEKVTKELEALLQEYPKDKQLYKKYLLSLIKNKEYATAKAKLETYDTIFDDKEYCIRLNNSVEIKQNNFEEVFQNTLTRLTNKTVFAGELNDIAWISLFKRDSLEQAIELSEASVKIAPQDPEKLHTLAVLYAKVGEFSKAHEYYKNFVSQKSTESMEASDWCLLGLIAKGLGLHSYADEIFNKVEKPEDSDYEYSSWHLINNK